MPFPLGKKKGKEKKACPRVAIQCVQGGSKAKAGGK